MGHYIAEFTVDPESSLLLFLESFNRLVTGSELQSIATSEGVTSSVVHHNDGRINAILCYCERDDKNGDWRITAAISRTDSYANIRVEVRPLSGSIDLYRPRKPAIITLLLDGLKPVGELPFKASKSAFVVSNNYIAHIERLVAGTSQSDSPVIYTTKEFLASKGVEPDELAQRLYGLAYVLIERDKHMGKNLRKRLERQYKQLELWPASLLLPEEPVAKKRIVCLDSIEASGDAFLVNIESLLQESIVNSELQNETAWMTSNALLWTDGKDQTQAIEPAKNTVAVTITTEQTVSTTESTKQNDSSDSKFFQLQHGKEHNFVEDEALEMVLDAIDYYVRKKLIVDTDDGTRPCRRADVLQAVLDATILQDTQVAANRTKVRSILSGTRSINKETESDLQKMGIHVKRGGKHPKLFLAQDHRYKVTAPSSGSDVNGWQNVVRELNKVFF